MLPESSSQVKVPCKACGNLAPSTEFQLDYHEGKMVCLACYQKNRKTSIKPSPPPQPLPERPPGWDEEDELLEQLNKQKKKTKDSLDFKELPGTDKCIITCGQCTFTFKFNTKQFYPPACPYCRHKIPLEVFKKPF
ncbi:hypothetical protein CMO92_00305 [Candidatus Woesearchaeota archaeon]|mgnify:CR=1 FL=1|nr:hypothetical protein [Candidatus Woesearchaeota archaeon]